MNMMAGNQLANVVQKLFNRKISLIIKFKVKYFRGYMTSLKYLYIEHISLAIIHDCSHYSSGALDCSKNYYSYYLKLLHCARLFCNIYNLVDPAFYAV